ncbi:hypothetical protein C2S53_003558 [Perilla frutescens var. hirtella]|uniref:Transcription factor CBF/NF-Y/archaeal histone domain-containing protein n=1 Tax=Perilla frutescens var. hirtella TaxID=608512 RepID=A0AAD4P1I4_PERFH|nr:hypothetical protein C2S53_003558 [Perilla frutescens var. hirtella]
MESGGRINPQHIYNDARVSRSGVAAREDNAGSRAGGGGNNIPRIVDYENPEPGFMRNPDEYMPIANILRIMRRTLPPHAKVADDAKETVQECVTEFISFVTSEANARCHRECRKTVTAEDVLSSMAALGFNDYVQPLSLFLNRYRDQDPERRASRLGFALPPPPPRMMSAPPPPYYVDHQLPRVDGRGGGEGSSGGAEFGRFGSQF